MGSQGCDCSAEKIARYQSKISGPILDRIDLHIPVNAIDNSLLFKEKTDQKGASNADISRRVGQARILQIKR